MEFISIGPNCTSKDRIIESGLRKCAYPFDSIFSSLEMVKHCILDRFAVFLDKQYYRQGPHGSTHHLFYSKFLNTEVLRRHHIAHGLDDIARHLENREIFLHHNLLNAETYSAYVRRCQRVLDLLDNNDKIVFVYCDRYTNDFDELIEFYNHFSDNKNIYVIGIFENNCEKKMLYESPRCKIYQNYDIKSIFDEQNSIVQEM